MSKWTRNVTKDLSHLFTGDKPLTIKFDDEKKPHIFRDGHELHQSTCGGSKERGYYLCISISDQNYLIHRLVGWWLVHNDPKYSRLINENWETHHKDRNPQNNSLDNLLVLTRSEHAKLHNIENLARRKFNRLVKALEEQDRRVEEQKARRPRNIFDFFMGE